MIGIRRRRAISAAAIATGAILAVGLSTPAYASPQLAGGESAASVTAGGPRGGWGHHHGGGGHHGGGHHGGGNGGGTVTSSDRLVQAVTAKGIIKHLKALQRIADRNDGNRSAGSEGHVESAEYIEAVLHRAGYQTERQPFSYDKTNLDRAEFSQVAPDPVDYVLQDQFYPMDYSGEGEVTAAAVPVDVNLEGDRSSSSGCEAEDFADFPAGAIALIQRGTCSFADKAANAEAAGAAGVVIFNQGNDVPGDDRFGVILGTLGDFGTGIPVLGTSFEIGETLVAATDAQLRIVVETTTVTVDTFNVIAKTAKGDPTKQVVVGAHLDSVAEGPGINDNGSGSAAILEVAVQLAKIKAKPANQIVFAWWSGEEDGLQGSNYYVSQLTEEQAANTGLNLNFDMVGSPNAVNFVYDGDGDAFGEAGPEGSAEIEHVFNEWFTAQGEPFKPTAFDGRSDYFGFISAGIPAGGLFTGAEGIKSDEEAAQFGGTAGEAYDPCYHQACDTIANVSKDALETNADAMAHAVWTFSESTRKPGGGHGHHGGWGNWNDHWGWGHGDGHGHHGDGDWGRT
ncbi:MAG: M28 family peptidase [Microbacteriaceae bacterium]|nr:M28 family peptidase [Microbacteriaceae bacterium]